ncbi:dihydropteroate synthase [Polaribacter undariae]|uniref:Dihydropteroate synthase n=1 Tax=Polaribacter sejongensis TaxID=985043 RepID=A0AAJ1QWP6_9FLAO|nr:dihydropteroate synthase [Polaribacter undariae]MDN3619688.1 dihydropteroate synthase [Polaribacter undariae]UWD31455.1 dihydropteroate synthase [Polaribacter undariae]
MTINCKGTLVDLTSPKVMGILNITPDSFFDGGKYKNESDILSQTEKMLLDGATFIDVGAYSSRPGAKHISEEEELQRIVPVIDLLVQNFPEIIISVDTFRSKIAQETINAGAAIVNDISGGKMDANMFATVANLQVPYILMHMLGTPQNMQKNPIYTDVTKEIISFFAEQIYKLHQLKLNDIIIDVGFGFGKTNTHNFEILKNLALFKSLEAPILAGISRKSMLYKTLDISAQEALNATTSANTIALLNGANILRVHDVKEAVEAVKIVNQLSF